MSKPTQHHSHAHNDHQEDGHKQGHKQRNKQGNDHDHSQGNNHDHSHHSPEMFRNRFWLSLVLTLPVLYYAEQFQIWFSYQALQFPGSQWVSPLLGSVLYFYGGLVFLRGALHELRSRQPGMMTLIGFAITVAFGYSLAVSLGLEGMPFYWELATLVVIMLLGHWFEMASVERASGALQELASLMPSTAHRLVAKGETEEVPVQELSEGDSIMVRPGEQVPADGEVTEGRSSMNEAFLTGESRPVPKKAGDEVIAGAVNSDGAVTVRITRIGDEMTLNQIQRLVEEAQKSRGRFQNLADRAAAWLFYVALGAGFITFGVWLIAADTVQFAIARTVTVLVIACPHALGLAIPLVIVNATALSAKNGILVRNREAFERARRLQFVAFDKTGTLTEGMFAVREVYPSQAMSADEALQLTAALEGRSEHPLAAAIVDAAREKSLDIPEAQAFEVTSGQGVSAEIDGQTYRVGRQEWADELGLQLAEGLEASLAEAESRGESVVVLMNEAEVLALISLADKVRGSARQTIDRLKEQNITPVMITGDAEAVAKTVAADLGIERYYARVLPQDKANIIKELLQEGPVAFVGDGINDAPALLEATIGIAIGAGTNVAIESADLVLIENDPLDVLAALKLSKATYRKMIQNLWWAAGYNIVALPLAAGVLAGIGFYLSPAVGALLMSLSTIIVAINAMLLRRLDLSSA